MTEPRPCKREDLRAAVESVVTATLDNEGNVSNWIGDDPDLDNINQYYCLNCLSDFVPEGTSHHDLGRAWQSALDHLPSVRTSDGRIVRVEVG